MVSLIISFYVYSIKLSRHQVYHSSIFPFVLLHIYLNPSSKEFRKEAIRLDEWETSCQVVACFIPHSMIWPDQPQRSFVFELNECGS